MHQSLYTSDTDSTQLLLTFNLVYVLNDDSKTARTLQ